MNRTIKDALGLMIAFSAVSFITFLINPEFQDKGRISSAFIGVAYFVGRGQIKTKED